MNADKSPAATVKDALRLLIGMVLILAGLVFAVVPVIPGAALMVPGFYFVFRSSAKLRESARRIGKKLFPGLYKE